MGFTRINEDGADQNQLDKFHYPNPQMKFALLCLFVLGTLSSRQVLYGPEYFGSCFMYEPQLPVEDYINAKNQKPEIQLDFKNSFTLQMWFQLYEPSYGGLMDIYRNIKNDNISTVQYLFSLSENQKYNVTVFANKTTFGTILNGAIKIAYITLTPSTTTVELWHLLTLSISDAEFYLGIWNPQNTTPTVIQEFNKTTISDKKLTFRYGGACAYVNETYKNYGFCGVGRQLAIRSGVRWGDLEKWQQIAYSYIGSSQLILSLALQPQLPQKASAIDGLIHAFDASPLSRNATYLIGKNKKWALTQVKVRGGIQQSQANLLQVTISFRMFIKDDGVMSYHIFRNYRAQYKQIGVKLTKEGPKFNFLICFDEDAKNPCQIIDLGIVAKKQYIIVILFTELDWKSSVWMGQAFAYDFNATNLRQSTFSGQFSVKYVYQRGDQSVVGDQLESEKELVQIRQLKMWNGIEVQLENDGKCILQLMVQDKAQCIICEKDVNIVDGICQLTKAVETKCNVQCKTCTTVPTECVTCSGNRVNPPLCDCPALTFYNDYQESCATKQVNTAIEYGQINLNQEQPDHYLRYWCDRQVRCEGYNNKYTFIEKTFSVPFAEQPQLVTGVMSLKYMGTQMDFMITQVYVTLGGFKIQVAVNGQTMLENIVISWMAFIPDREGSQLRSFMRQGDIYVFDNVIQQALDKANTQVVDVQATEMDIDSIFGKTLDDDAELELYVFLNGVNQCITTSKTPVDKLPFLMNVKTNITSKTIQPIIQISANYTMKMLKFSSLLIDAKRLHMSTHFLNNNSFAPDITFIQIPRMQFKLGQPDAQLGQAGFVGVGMMEFEQVKSEYQDDENKYLAPNFEIEYTESVSGTNTYLQLQNTMLVSLNVFRLDPQINCSHLINTTYCSTCDPLLLQCKYCINRFAKPPKCTSCIEGAALPSLEGGECGPCDPHCTTCHLINECKECKPGFSGAPKCNTCNSSQYDNRDPVSPQCLSCPTRCNGCYDSETCITCQDQSWLALGTKNQCRECGTEGYYFADDGICWTCSHKCLQCQDTATNCLVCSEHRGGIPNCECVEGYYDTQEAKYYFDSGCSACHPTCQTCTSYSALGCVTCSDKLHRVFNASLNTTSDWRLCDCAPYYYYNPVVAQERKLSSYWECMPCYPTCYQCFGSGANQCTMCLAAQFRVFVRELDDAKCVCQPGYFENEEGICRPCYHMCKYCLNENEHSCTECYKRRSNSILFQMEAVAYLLSTNENSGQCIYACPGPDFWGEPTSGNCRFRCGASYNPSLRQCCYLPDENCTRPYQWIPRVNQHNNSEILMDFTGQMALKSNWQEYFIQNIHVNIQGLIYGENYRIRPVCEDLKSLKENAKPYIPESSLKEYSYIGSQFIVEIVYMQPVQKAYINFSMNTTQLRDPYGVNVRPVTALLNETQKLDVTEPEPLSSIENANAFRETFYIASQVVAWTILPLMIFARIYCLNPIIDLFQEIYYLGYLSINLPYADCIRLRSLEPFSFTYYAYPLEEKRGVFSYTYEDENVLIEHVYGTKNSIHRQMHHPVSYAINISQDMIFVIVTQFIRGVIDSLVNRDTSKGRIHTVLQYIQAFLYSLFGQYFYIKLSYLTMASYTIFEEIEVVNRDNVFEYFAATMFYIYVLIVMSRFIFDINNPSRVGKLPHHLQPYFLNMNDPNCLTHWFKRNVYTIALLRKVAVMGMLFAMTKHSEATSQIVGIILVYCFELIYQIGVIFLSIRSAATNKNSQQIITIIVYTSLTIVKLISYMCMIPVYRLNQDIRASTDENFMTSNSLVDEKQAIAGKMVMLILGLTWSVGLFGFCCLVFLASSFPLLKNMQLKIGKLSFSKRSQLYDEHQELFTLISNFRQTQPVDSSPLQAHTFKSHVNTSYQVIPLYYNQQMLTFNSMYLQVLSIDHKKRKQEFSANMYKLVDVFSYKDFIVIINNLSQVQSTDTDQTYCDQYLNQGKNLTCWIYHPSYQVNYFVDDDFSFKHIILRDKRLIDEYNIIKQSKHKDEMLNFASVSQIQYSFASSYRVEDCEKKVGKHVPELLYYCLFDHESAILRQAGVPLPPDCRCDQCYFIKKWDAYHKVQRNVQRTNGEDSLRPWSIYDSFQNEGVEVKQVCQVLKETDTLTKVLLSYLCYEDRRLNPTNLKLLDDLLSKRRHYDSDSSDSEEEEDKDGFDQFIQKDGNINEDEFLNKLLKYEEDLDEDSMVLELPFKPQHFLVRYKVLQLH